MSAGLSELQRKAVDQCGLARQKFSGFGFTGHQKLDSSICLELLGN